MKNIIIALTFIIFMAIPNKSPAYEAFGGADDALHACLSNFKTPEEREQQCASSFIVKICVQNPLNFSLHSNAMCMLREYKAWNITLENFIQKYPMLQRKVIKDNITKNTHTECKKALEQTEQEMKMLVYYKCLRDFTAVHTLDQYADTTTQVETSPK